MEAKNKLWTKDFSIITFGTIISMLGNAVSGFAIGLLVLDYTGSTFLYALFMVCYSVPRVVMPLIAGPYMDRFSRKKVIYSLDFLSAGLYALIAFLLWRSYFNYTLLLLMSVIVGSVDSIYTVAYESLYPTLISEGNYSKAYSVSSLIYPLANTIMVPIAGICYGTVGLIPLFAFNAVTFLLAAIAETQIKADETHIKKRTDIHSGFKGYALDFKEGLKYLRDEKGLMTIAVYFFFTMFAGGAVGTLTLPYFKTASIPIGEGLADFLSVFGKDASGVGLYTVLMGVATFGRLIGGTVQYRVNYPAQKKFAIAMTVYISICILEGAYLYLPVAFMALFMLLDGMMGVTSYNIRISATQNYVTDEKRGRFNGIFQMINMGGMILGQLVAGALGDLFSPRDVIAGFMIVNLIAAFAVMFKNRAHVKPIYNREV